MAFPNERKRLPVFLSVSRMTGYSLSMQGSLILHRWSAGKRLYIIQDIE